MGTEIYLDTARLGRMCPGARLAERDFGRLVSRFGCSLYLERFLSHGFHSLPKRFQDRVPELRCWSGIQRLHSDFADFVGQPAALNSYLFGQSSAMIRFAAECLFNNACRVLATDLIWPAYLRVIQEAAAAKGAEVVTVPLQAKIFSGELEANDLCQLMTEHFHASGCNGLFMSDISYLGVRLPADNVLRQVEDTCQFSVVDGAQALNHRPLDLQQTRCDLYMAGTQKWMCAYHPLRIAFIGRERHAAEIEGVANRYTSQDPLLHFSRGLAGKETTDYGETVNLSGLISAAGALQEATRSNTQRRWKLRRQNATRLAEWCHGSLVHSLISSATLQSGILLLRLHAEQRFDRNCFAERGLVASVFPDGIVRLSMPINALSLRALSTLFRSVSAAVT